MTLPPGLIGRDAELGALLTQQRAAARGRGSIALVSGEAGIGKTRLLRELREKLGTRALILAGSCTEFAAHPFGVFLEALQPVATIAPLKSEGSSRDEQFAAFLAALTSASERRTVVLLLEDLHWADAASLQLLLYAARFIERARILVVGTVRSDDLRDEHPVLPYLARLARLPSLTRINLHPLADAAIVEILQSRLPHGVHLPSERLAEIAGRAEGNPFFAEELLRAALETAVLARNLPLSIRAVISERYALLSPTAREIIVVAAVIGRQFHAGLLAQVLETNLAATLRAIAEARDLQLLDEVSGGQPIYRFRHALVREALYEQLLVAQAQPLHAKIAHALESRPDAAALAIDLGYHFLAAREAAPALRYNELAGDQAGAITAYEDAFRLFGRALDAAALDDHAARGRLLAKCARAISDAGFLARASDYYDSAMAAYRAAGMFDAAGELAYASSASWQVQGRLSEAVQKLESAFAAYPAASRSPVKARIAVARAFAYSDDCNAAAAQNALAQARAACVLDDKRASLAYYNASVYALVLDGRMQEARAEFDCYFAAAQAAGDDVLHAQTCSSIASNGVINGFDDVAKRAFDIAFPIAHERKLKGLYRSMASSLAMFHLRNGRLEEARKVTESVLQLGDALMNRFLQCLPAVCVGSVLCDDDLIERSEPWSIIEEVLQTRNNMWIGRFAGPYAEYLWQKRRYDEAAAILTRSISAIRHPLGTHETLLAAARFGSAADRARARSILDIGRAMPQAIHHHAVSDFFDALCARREGRADAAARAGTRAHDLYERLGWKYYQALALEAAGSSEAALALLRECGAIRDVRRIELDPPARNPKAPPSGLSLTAREREIANHIVEGASNREIAARLSISQKTVEKHITAMFEKLGLHSRSQLVAHMTRSERT